MLKLSKWIVVGILSSTVLAACGKPHSESTSSVKGDKAPKKEKGSVFNLAEYLKDSIYSEELKPYVETGDLIFGDLKKIGVRSNVTVETSGKSTLTPNGSRNIEVRYFINGSVFPEGTTIAGTKFAPGKIVLPNGDEVSGPLSFMVENKEYQFVDMKAKAGFDVEGAEGYFRLFGNDVYHLSKALEYDQEFHRDLSATYPILPGVEAKATIGGKVGFKAKVRVREDDAISLIFEPVVALSSSISPRFSVFKILTAGVEGKLTLFETTAVTSASVRYLPENDFAYGDISMDTAAIKALDGKVSLVAKAGLVELFGNLGEAANQLFKKITGKKLEVSWEHVVWDPKPLFAYKIPARGVFFTSDMSGKTSKECSAIRDEVYAAGDIMEKIKKDASGTAADIAQTAQANLAKTALSIGSTCGH